MPLEKIETPPWKIEIERNSAGLVSHVRVLASQPRVVYYTTIGPFARDRAGRQFATPETKSQTDKSIQPGVVCDCGISYAGLSAETLLAHGDLISAAPDLYAALEDLSDGTTHDWTRKLAAARAALAKARGESPDAT